jgi:hypothetical protein
MVKLFLMSGCAAEVGAVVAGLDFRPPHSSPLIGVRLSAQRHWERVDIPSPLVREGWDGGKGGRKVRFETLVM